MTQIHSQCSNCIHLQNVGYPAKCAAFPAEIPDEIYLTQVDHRQPYDGDHGIRWTPADPGLPHPLGPVSQPRIDVSGAL